MTKTVKDIHPMVRPLYEMGSRFLACMLVVQLWLHRLSVRIEYRGTTPLERGNNYILSVWHEDLTLFFTTHRYFRDRHIWMTYPAWYMRPIHIVKGWMGIQQLAYGATGIDGQVALNEVMEKLKEGWSSFISPDGPGGPLKVIKEGVLIMSAETGTPVIPIHFKLTSGGRFPTWDKKRFPWPGSRVTVLYGPSIYVTATERNEARMKLHTFMSEGTFGV